MISVRNKQLKPTTIGALLHCLVPKLVLYLSKLFHILNRLIDFLQALVEQVLLVSSLALHQLKPIRFDHPPLCQDSEPKIIKSEWL